jgi:translocation and assembly module TamB
VIRRIVLWLAGLLLGLPLLAVAGVLIAANTDPGRRLIESETATLTGGMVVLKGISGSFPLAPRLARVEIHDAAGAWLVLEDLSLETSLIDLAWRNAHLRRLSARAISFARLPHSSASAKDSTGGGFELPVQVTVDTLTIGRLDVGDALIGTRILVSVEGKLHLDTLTQGKGELRVADLEGPGRYTLSGDIGSARLAAHLSLNEPTPGLVEGLAKMPDLGALSIQADLDGPRDAAGLTLAVAAGPLRADANGRIDLVGQAGDLDVTANAPAMQPRADLSWAGIALEAHFHGPFTRPDATGHLNVERLNAGGAAMQSLTANLSGNTGQVALDGKIEGLRLPGPSPTLLQADPILLSAQARLDTPDRPVTFALRHPLFNVSGNATTGNAIGGKLSLGLPNLAPLAAVGGVALAGNAALDATVSIADGATHAVVDGTLHITGGMAPLPGLIGDARLALGASVNGSDITLTHLTLDGRSLKLAANGGLRDGRAQAEWTLGLADLHVLAPTLAGALQAKGHVDGPMDELSAQAELDGDVTVQGHRGPMKATLTADGLPGKPNAHLVAQGSLDNAPLSVDVAVQRDAAGAMKFDIAHTDWKSARIEGGLTLAPGASLPQGRLTLRMSRLADLRPLTGLDLVGAIDLSADLSTPETLKFQLNATQAGLPGTAEAASARLTGEVRDPTSHPALDATLLLDGLHAGAISGGGKILLRGPQEALALQLDARLAGVAGADATIASAATIDALKRQIVLSRLQADWKGLAARLLAPARIDLANGVSIDRLRLGAGQAELEVAGRVSPTLDLAVSARRISPDLAKLFVPDLQADGMLQAEAKLAGTPARPTGTIRLTADGLHMRTGPGRSLPVANLVANATLTGSAARIDANLTAGTTRLAVMGSAPLGASGALDLRATGAADLALLDPILAPQGRRMRGQVTLDATVTGPLAAPQLAGTAQLSGGDLQDFSQGVHLSAMQASLQAGGQSLRISQFTAQAGGGSISASGSIGVLETGLPVDLSITARHAKPINSDLLSAVLDADLTLRGQVMGALAAAGTVRIETANIQIPENLPTSIAVLNVRTRGEKPAASSTAGTNVTLALDLSAPQGVFVRGRGLDAELGGKMHVGGSANDPRTSGAFTLRRGLFNLAGVTLNFASGEISFNGSSKIDPSLAFVANSSNGAVTATLKIGGYASAPKITLSSVPDLPQDEVLAYLLFKTSAANLSGFQLAEIGAALAQISGVTGGLDPLASARKALGLDELNVGTSATGSPTLNAGRYVAKGVFVGARQGIGGNAGSQATVQIDIAKGLKLETDAGSGTGGNSVGLTYQFEY